MVKAFGANKQFWRKHHGTKQNAIGLTQDITLREGGFFTVKFGGGLCVLVEQKAPTQFFNVCSFFPKQQKDTVIRESLRKEVNKHKEEYAKGKGKATAGKTKSAIKAGKSLRIMYHFADDLPFYTVRGLEARALRLLGHEDFEGLKNGKHFTGDDFSDEESMEEDRSAPDEDAQQDLLMRACRDSVALSKLPVQCSPEPPKKK
ncbi:NaCP60E, partial [Symbiodinium pilosum]